MRFTVHQGTVKAVYTLDVLEESFASLEIQRELSPRLGCECIVPVPKRLDETNRCGLPSNVYLARYANEGIRVMRSKRSTDDTSDQDCGNS